MLSEFGFAKIKTFISTRPETKAVGDDAEWQIAQSALESAVKNIGLEYEIDEGGGAFYGPKIDIKIQDAIGREWQCSTIQFDFNLPERFDMSYINSNGEKERPLMIHRALLGSLERFFGILIEHYAGKFPTWLAPVQAKVLTIHESGEDYAESVVSELKDAGLRIQTDYSTEKIGYKVRNGITQKVPYLVIIGKSEIENGTISVRDRETNETTSMAISEFIEKINVQ